VITIADPPEDSRVEAEVSASSFSTRNFMRDPQVRSRLFLDARQHPAISFRSDGIRQHRGGWSVTGVLTVKGHTAPVELTVDGVCRGRGDRRPGRLRRRPLSARHHDDARGGSAPTFRPGRRARHTSLATPCTAARHHPERWHE
jgi:hypothetical protein